jgi:hypothetical protein
MQQSWWRGVVVLSIFVLAVGCAMQESPAPTPAGQAQQTIPADSPFAKIHEGMSKGEMTYLLGQPTDQETTVTGKAFIPFYFGGDASVTRMHYKGLGRVYVSGGAAFGGGEKVLKIEHDPQESGFRK